MHGLRISVPAHAGVKRQRTTPSGAVTIGKLLGCGAQGQVHAATVARTGARVAVKILPRHSAEGQQEADVLATLPAHRHIVAVPSQCTIEHSDNRVWIPLELAETDVLEALLEHGRFSMATACRYFGHIVSAVRHCHSHGVYHLDIKPENVLLLNGRAMLADFGSSLRTSARPAMACFPSGSVSNAAPEVVPHTGFKVTSPAPYAAASADVWSLGVLLFVMVTGRPPWSAPVKSDRLFAAFAAGEYPWPAEVTGELRALLAGMFTVDPTARLTLEAVAAHAWLHPAPSQDGARCHRRTSSAGALPTKLHQLRLSLSVGDTDQAALLHSASPLSDLSSTSVLSARSCVSTASAATRPCLHASASSGSDASVAATLASSSSVNTVLSRRTSSTCSFTARAQAATTKAPVPRGPGIAQRHRRRVVRGACSNKRRVFRHATSRDGAGADVDGPMSPVGKRSAGFFRSVDRVAAAAGAAVAAAARASVVAATAEDVCVVTAMDLAACQGGDDVDIMSPCHKRVRRGGFAC